MSNMRPVLCLDFDGVLHSYKSGWKGADVIPDEPVPGAQEFVRNALVHFDVVVYSSRSHQTGGISAMRKWMQEHDFPSGIVFAKYKPSAHVTIDDRGLQFTGEWPGMQELLNFEPWNKR